MADGKADGSELEVPFVFVKHGDPLPLKWMAEHPGWVRFPATLVPRPEPGTRRGRATAAAVEAAESSVLGRPVSMGAPMVERPGMRNRGRPPRFPGRFGGEEDQPLREDPIAAYRRVTKQLAAMGLMEPVAAWKGRHPHGAHKAEKAVPPPPVPVPPAPDVNADLSLSAEGHAFVFREETQGHPDRTRHLYWPGYHSGVTLGAGYDFKFRLREQIVEDLISVGVDPATARALSVAGATKGKKGHSDNEGLSGPAAEKFAKEHAGEVDLSEENQRFLLLLSIKQYENDVREKVTVRLSQDEFDALVSFAMSRGRKNLETIAKLLNSGRRAEAISHLKRFDDSGGAGAMSRRHAEADIMTSGFDPAGAGTTGNRP